MAIGSEKTTFTGTSSSAIWTQGSNRLAPPNRTVHRTVFLLSGVAAMERAINGPVRVGLEGALDRILEISGTVFLLGGIDTGKTTFGIELVHACRQLP